eukprot:jgi/Chlat1/9300/Chrsp99S08541
MDVVACRRLGADGGAAEGFVLRWQHVDGVVVVVVVNDDNNAVAAPLRHFILAHDVGIPCVREISH